MFTNLFSKNRSRSPPPNVYSSKQTVDDAEEHMKNNLKISSADFCRFSGKPSHMTFESENKEEIQNEQSFYF